MYFAKFASGVPAADCPDNDNHNVDTADSIVTTVPVALSAGSDDDAVEKVKAMVAITRDSSQSQQYAALFALTLRKVAMDGESVLDAVQSAAKTIGMVLPAALGSDPVTA